MRYVAIASDYDGTLAKDGFVAPATLSLLEKVRISGRKLILVTGRHLPDLQTVFPELHRFDRVVAENGALLYDPGSREQKVLTETPPDEFMDALRKRKIPFEVGHAIISSWVPHEIEILKTIQALSLNHQVVFNKGAVMVLPPGVNKATGLEAALRELKLSSHNVIAMGDGENDHPFLAACECGVAVANAVRTLQERADIVLAQQNGEGVADLLQELLEDDLKRYDDQIQRRAISLGTAEDAPARSLRLSANRNGVLVAGASASGKSSLIAGVLEQLSESDYQFCLIDPEGDYDNFGEALSFGSAKERPDPALVVKALENPKQSIIVNLMGVSVRERPEVFSTLLPKILELRTRVARPHWLIIDEAHHLMPEAWSPATSTVPQVLGGLILVTVHPEHISSAALTLVDVVIATGTGAQNVLTRFADANQLELQLKSQPPGLGQALVWFTRKTPHPVLVHSSPAKGERRRHKRNYAEGQLSEAQSFYFRGPDSKVNLRAQNLQIFLQIAEGIDDETWQYHLVRGDYSKWFGEVVKDIDLADAARSVENDKDLSPAKSREKLREAIESRYTAAP